MVMSLTLVVFERIDLVENMTDECIKFLNRFFINTVVDGFPVDTSLYNSGIFQFPEMLRYRRLCERQNIHNIIADTGVGREQIFNNGNSRRMSHGFQ